MDSNLPGRQVVSRDTFADNNNVKVVFSKTSDGVDDLEEGELSDDGSPDEMSQRVVTRPDVPDLLRDVGRVQVEVGKRNPWGGVSEVRAVGVRVRESLETDCEDSTLKITRKSVRERLGWKRREESGSEPDWKVKMKRPRMEMVADMEERKGSVRNRLYGAKRSFSEDRFRMMNPLEKMKGPVVKSRKEVLDKKIVRSVLNDVETQNRDDLVERDFPPLSARFMGSLERRPRCRETIKRTVEFENVGESDSRKRKGNTVEVVEKVANNLRKESVDSLENDNGSDLDDDSSMLIQFIQSDVESSDEESKKIREAVRKIEEAKKREETRRMKLKLMEKEENTKLGEDKGSKSRKELKNHKLKDEEKIRVLKEKSKEMRVREKIKALDATEKKLLMEKSRQDRIRRKIKSKQSTKDSKVKVKSKSRKVDSDESESSGSDSSSSSSSDTTDGDSSSDSSGQDVVKKRKKSGIRSKKQRMLEKDGKGKRGWSMRAASTPKKEASKVQKAKESSEEYKEKVSDLKSKLKDYLKKAKEKKMI